MGDMLETRDVVEEGWPVLDLSFPDLGLRDPGTSSCPSWTCTAKPCATPRGRVWRRSWRQGAAPSVCRLAVQEGKLAFLGLAVFRGCPCDTITLGIAARAGAGNLPLLMAVYHAALLPNGFLSRGISGLSHGERYNINQAAMGAAEEGHAACLAALVEWFGIFKPGPTIPWKGGVDCPDALRG
jgi:hypothetical protein